jgi:glycosyltransferase involved in cell wall biosynthesis
MGSAARILVVIPCFNEADSIEAVLSEVGTAVPEATLLVVDDGSSDQTATLAARSAKVLRLPVNLGIGGAVQTGLRYATRHGFDFCIQVDGDGQHLGSEIKHLFVARECTGSNLIIGSRFLGDSQFKSKFFRRVGIAIIRRVSMLVSGFWVTDPTSGFRLFDREALKVFSEDYPYDYPEPVSILIAKLSGLTVSETAVRMKERAFGKSSIVPITYMFRVCTYLLFIRLRRYLKS